MNTVCASCQATNRVPQDRLADGAKCGRCGSELFNGEVANATAAILDSYLQDDLPVVVDFWPPPLPPWCSPCVNFAPMFKEVAQERSGQVRFIKMNPEAEPALSTRFRIRSIPTIMIFKKGELVDMLNGTMPKAPFNE
ncbi:thioredoxin TrxC [Candidatus Pantoea persica]|uniref:thioredoxin TrxC n=1 Tax=Candidatus Pantoea persica TaxID=2518128 RepID=UPI00215D63E2|nr:thioredoxin TrxC [Candidatus Pantoea persica]MBA2817274.1 Thioredoxin-2 [Candidatus Pantoea persica]